jgi:arginine deiminase
VFREVADLVRCHSLYPKDDKGGIEVRTEDKHLLDVVKEALGLSELRAIATGGNSFEAEREQWDDGNNVVALEPGVVVAYDRNTYTNTLMRKAGIEVITIRGCRTWPRPRRRPLHDLPDLARPRVLILIVHHFLGRPTP